MLLRMLLKEHAGALRADFRRVYQIDLLDIYRGRLGLIEAADYAFHLPPGSAVWRAEGGPLAWTDEAHFLSAVEYNTHVAWWLKTKDGSKGKNPPKPTEPPKSKAQEAADELRVMRRLALKRQRAAEQAERQQEPVDGPGTA